MIPGVGLEGSNRVTDRVSLQRRCASVSQVSLARVQDLTKSLGREFGKVHAAREALREIGSVLYKN